MSDDEFAPPKKEQRAAGQMPEYEGHGQQTQEYDEIMSSLLHKVPPGEGDEFGAVKPWLGAIKEPIPKPKVNKKAPAEKFDIDWVYGYRSEEARMNCQFNSAGNAVYPTAAIGVVFDY
jgi:microtubule-associated protein-like 6